MTIKIKKYYYDNGQLEEETPFENGKIMNTKESEYLSLAIKKAKKDNKSKAKICWFCGFAAFLAVCFFRICFKF